MTNFKSADEILDFAIKNEEDAADFYTDLASKVEWVGMKGRGKLAAFFTCIALAPHL